MVAGFQGFPDYYALVGSNPTAARSLTRPEYLESRYRQIGNAVAPPVAAALGE